MRFELGGDLRLEDEAATARLGVALAGVIGPGEAICLTGPLGAGKSTLAHFDLYRLTSPDEAYEIGLDEALEDGAAIIEWPQRLEGRLPPHRLDIDIELDGAARRARLTPHGAWEGRAIEF